MRLSLLWSKRLISTMPRKRNWEPIYYLESTLENWLVLRVVYVFCKICAKTKVAFKTRESLTTMKSEWSSTPTLFPVKRLRRVNSASEKMSTESISTETMTPTGSKSKMISSKSAQALVLSLNLRLRQSETHSKIMVLMCSYQFTLVL